jgi:ppGpp synthetase/RelA/SpoT-type nucleotidyltranferase
MNYDQYVREWHARYESFARMVAAILQSAVDASQQNFRLQQIKFRAKDPTSLKRKLTERGLLQSDAIEGELKDLAGCRLVFYTNTDVDQFLQSRLIFENFSVDFDGSRFHHSVGKTRSADELYFAIHYLVSLDERRLALPEYCEYRRLRCEVQLQTILHHAWAETSHDILYHKPDMTGFGTRQFEAIERRLAKIMNEHLLPAGYEFQKVQYDFQRLMQGKELFDRGTLAALEAAQNNNERYELLHQIQNDLLPYYDDVPGMAPELIRIAAESVRKARTTGVQPVETTFGNVDEHTSDDVANEALQIIDKVRYVDIHLTFRALCEMYAATNSNEERCRILQSAEALACNDINVWRRVGGGVQKVLLDELLALTSGEREALRPLVLTVCQHILNPELQGTTWSFDTVTLQRGTVLASSEYAQVRGNTLALLFDLYRGARTPGDKLGIIQTLSEATRLPMDTSRDNSLVQLVLEDTRKIVDFFLEGTSDEPLDILEHLEHQFLWLYRHAKGFAKSDTEDPLSLKARDLLMSITRFRDNVNDNLRFVRFKTLVGFDSVFPPEWQDDGDDIEGPQAYRTARVAEYVGSISSDNADEWYEVIKVCASVKSNDMATFPSFAEFLKQLSARKPEVILKYVRTDEELLTPFLPAILQGLAESNQRPDLAALLNKWVELGRHLAAIARHLRLTAEPAPELLENISRKAITSHDAVAVIEVIAVVIVKKLNLLIGAVFLPCMRFLTENQDTRWVAATWYMPETNSFLEALSEDEAKAVLDNLVSRDRLDYHDEKVLRPIANNHRRIVWLYFGTRIGREIANCSGEKYEAVPHELRNLKEPLAREPALAIDIVRTWFKPDDALFSYRGGRLLHAVFPTFGKGFEERLSTLVQIGNTDDIDFVLCVIRSYYEGGIFLQGICKELVNILPEDDPRLGQIEIVLQNTGGVWGQFGMVEAYQRKKQEMEAWLSDPRSKVRNFADRYCRSLDRTIASEQRRSEADYELGRRGWDDQPG